MILHSFLSHQSDLLSLCWSGHSKRRFDPQSNVSRRSSHSLRKKTH